MPTRFHDKHRRAKRASRRLQLAFWLSLLLAHLGYTSVFFLPLRRLPRPRNRHRLPLQLPRRRRSRRPQPANHLPAPADDGAGTQPNACMAAPQHRYFRQQPATLPPRRHTAPPRSTLPANPIQQPHQLLPPKTATHPQTGTSALRPATPVNAPSAARGRMRHQSSGETADKTSVPKQLPSGIKPGFAPSTGRQAGFSGAVAEPGL